MYTFSIIVLASTLSLPIIPVWCLGKQRIWISTQETTWDQARATCENLGFRILDVTSEVIQNALLHFSMESEWIDNINANIWIGFHNSESGSTLDLHWGDCSLMNYSNWKHWEPQIVQSRMCVAMEPDFLEWIAMPCTNLAHVACVKDVGECIFEFESASMCTVDGLIVQTYDVLDLQDTCGNLCMTTSMDGLDCWLYEWDFPFHFCTLHFHNDPYFCDDRMKSKLSVTSGVKKCFNFVVNLFVETGTLLTNLPPLECGQEQTSVFAVTTSSSVKPTSQQSVLMTNPLQTSLETTPADPSPQQGTQGESSTVVNNATGSILSNLSLLPASQDVTSSTEVQYSGRSSDVLLDPPTESYAITFLNTYGGAKESQTETATDALSINNLESNTELYLNIVTTAKLTSPQTLDFLHSSFDPNLGSSSELSSPTPIPTTPLLSKLSSIVPSNIQPTMESTTTAQFPGTTPVRDASTQPSGLTPTETSKTVTDGTGFTSSQSPATMTEGTRLIEYQETTTEGATPIESHESTTDGATSLEYQNNSTQKVTLFTSQEGNTSTESQEATTKGATVVQSPDTTQREDKTVDFSESATHESTSAEYVASFGSADITTAGDITGGASATNTIRSPEFSTRYDALILSSEPTMVGSTSIDSTLDMITLETPLQVATRLSHYLCPCKTCFDSRNTSMSRLKKQLEKLLLLEAHNLSSYRRRKQSEQDERVSAACLGVTGVVLLILAFLFFVGMDAISYFHEI